MLRSRSELSRKSKAVVRLPSYRRSTSWKTHRVRSIASFNWFRIMASQKCVLRRPCFKSTTWPSIMMSNAPRTSSRRRTSARSSICRTSTIRSSTTGPWPRSVWPTSEWGASSSHTKSSSKSSKTHDSANSWPSRSTEATLRRQQSRKLRRRGVSCLLTCRLTCRHWSRSTTSHRC